jgi:acetyl esterase/lipase
VAVLGVAFGLAAAGFSLVPLASTLPVARANKERLSLAEYLLGAPGTGRGPDVTTQTVPYRTVAAQTLRLDVYQHANGGNTTRAAIIVVHGGSWRGGTKSDFASWDRWLARSGYVVFDIEYRLAPQPNWRAATGDVQAAVAWVKQNAAAYNVDPARVVLLGRSAGAHLALLAAYASTNDSTRAAAVVSLYGPTDLVWGYHNPANPAVLDTSAVLRAFLGGTPQAVPDAYKNAAPLSHVGPATPPTLLFHGGRDALVSPRHGVFLANELRAGGVPHQLVVLPYAQHGFDYNNHGWGAQIVRPILLRFLRAHL